LRFGSGRADLDASKFRGAIESKIKESRSAHVPQSFTTNAKFYSDYYIPAGEFPRPSMIGPKPYARTLIILAPFNFIIPGAIPSDFAGRPLIFVGVVAPPEIEDGKRAERLLTQGLAIIPINANGQPDFAHAVAAPPPL
jgi:hypothetical protein